MALKTLSKTNIVNGNTVQASDVSQSIDAFTGAEGYAVTLSGSLALTGSQAVSGSLTLKGNITITGSISNTGSVTTPPGTIGYALPANVYGASAATILGDPSGWLSIQVDGATYKIPLYN